MITLLLVLIGLVGVWQVGQGIVMILVSLYMLVVNMIFGVSRHDDEEL